MSENINPLELFKEELENDETYIRVNAVHRIKTIAQLIGADGIKNQLLPFIDQLIKKEDDEVLFALAEELGNLAPYLPNQVVILIPYLERLAQNDETVVRDNSVKAFINIYKLLSDNEINNHLIPVILKLASDANNFTFRVSAIQLMVQVYPKAGDKKQSIKQKFLELCAEDTPMVRRSIANKIGEFSNVIEKEYLMADLMLQFKQLTSDEQDSVRVISLESIRQIAKILTKEENKTHILPIIIAATEDKSWRVRLSLAKNFYDLSIAVGKDILDQSLLQTFINLLKDSEIEVKVAAIHSLKKLIELINTDKYQIIIPHLQNLCKDSNKEVKSGVAEVMSNLFVQVKKEPTLSKLLANIIDFIIDQDQDVRIGGIRAAAKYIIAYGNDALNSLIQHFKNTITDSKWRVRFETLNAIVDIAVNFQNYDIFIKNLEPLFLLYLKDKFSSIREEGANKLKDLVSVYKVEWVNQSLLSKLSENLAKDQSYLYRITSIYSIQQIIQVIPNDYTQEKLVPLLLRCLKDPVPNVRFVTCKILKSFGKQHLFTKQLQSELNSLLNDSDKDVKLYAQEALLQIA